MKIRAYICLLPIRPALCIGIIILFQAVVAGSRAEEVSVAGVDDQAVAVFFRSVEVSFRSKRVQDIITNLHRDFSYIMTYRTDDVVSAVENDIEKYRESVGSFFKSNPEIQDYTIIVDHIEWTGEQIMVLAQIKSVVQLNGIVNACDATSNYSLLHENGRLLIKDVRGEATCTNRKVEEGW